MAGFLNKKDRLIDYKLTENGRKQLASGDIRFKYYNWRYKMAYIIIYS